MPQTAKLLETAIAHHKLGQLKDAEKAYLELLRNQNIHPDGLRLLGALYLQTGQKTLAAEFLGKAARLLPKDPDTLTKFGIALRNLGQQNEAATQFKRALDCRSNYLPALLSLGGLCLELGLLDEATAHYERALTIRPDQLDAMIALGKALRQAGKTEASLMWMQRAQALFEKMLEADPRNTPAMNNLGILLRQMGKTDEAVFYYRKALVLRPDYFEATINLATALRDLGHLNEAIDCCRAALALRPDFADAYNNLGTFLQQNGQHEEAIGLFDEALKLNPSSIDAKWNKGLSLLALGQYKQGWELHEVGLGVPHMRGPHVKERRWAGEDLAGKRLLITCEQGLGDNLQFVRYAEKCKERGAHVIVNCPSTLRSLFSNCSFIDELPENTAQTPFDLHVPIMSLPYMFGTDMNSIPAVVPYLHVSETKRAQWADRLSGDGFKVGLVWAGNPRKKAIAAHLIDKRRSMELETLGSLFDVKGARFYNLQMGEKSGQIALCGLQEKMTNPMDDVRDFEDTAAIVEHLDLVITVDTSVAHLAGGMGKPVWILSRFDACWRWLQNRPDNPWYPTARIFGQQAQGDWTDVVGRVKAALVETI